MIHEPNFFETQDLHRQTPHSQLNIEQAVRSAGAISVQAETILKLDELLTKSEAERVELQKESDGHFEQNRASQIRLSQIEESLEGKYPKKPGPYSYSSMVDDFSDPIISSIHEMRESKDILERQFSEMTKIANDAVAAAKCAEAALAKKAKRKVQ